MGWIKNYRTGRRDGLHASAVRLKGHDRRLWECAVLVKEEGLEIWFRPKANIEVPPKSAFLEMERDSPGEPGSSGSTYISSATS
jgi:hypothetical protein